MAPRVPAFALLVVVAALAATFPAVPAETPSFPAVVLPRATTELIALSGDLAVNPAPSSWIGTSQPTIVARVVNESFGTELRNSLLTLDGRRLFPYWAPSNKTLWASPADGLPDGDHSVVLTLQDTAGRVVDDAWSFSTDTIPPRVDLDPLPNIADLRVFTITGTVLDDHLAEVRVNGFTATTNGTRFLVPVLLWPGHNDLLAAATDLAHNRGLAAGSIEWFPPAVENVTYQAFVHPNDSFLIRFPASWEVRPDEVLEGTLQTDVVASEPVSGTIRANIAVVSRFVGDGMTDDLLLSIMDDAILRLGSQTNIEVVSRPRFIASEAGAVAAQFSVVETIPEGDRSFRQVTGFWSRTVARLWLVLGSTSTSTVEAQWDAFQTAVDSFRVIEPPPAPPIPESPKEAIDRALVVTVAAILFVTAFSAVGFYTWRIRARRARVR